MTIPERPVKPSDRAIGLDWASAVIPHDIDDGCATALLIQFAERTRQLAVAAQQKEGLSATQIRLLMLLKRERPGISATNAAQRLGRSLPVLLDASSALLQLSLVSKTRVGAGSRFVLQLTDNGLSVANKLECWFQSLSDKINILKSEDKEKLSKLVLFLLE